MIQDLKHLMDFFNIDLFWMLVIIIGPIILTILKINQPKPKPKPTTADILADIRYEIGSLSDEVRGIKDRMK